MSIRFNKNIPYMRNNLKVYKKVIEYIWNLAILKWQVTILLVATQKITGIRIENLETDLLLMLV